MYFLYRTPKYLKILAIVSNKMKILLYIYQISIIKIILNP